MYTNTSTERIIKRVDESILSNIINVDYYLNLARKHPRHPEVCFEQIRYCLRSSQDLFILVETELHPCMNKYNVFNALLQLRDRVEVEMEEIRREAIRNIYA